MASALDKLKEWIGRRPVFELARAHALNATAEFV